MVSNISSLLIVEDNPADVTLYLRLLEDVEHGFEHIECVSTIKAAMDCLEDAASSTCCLLDFNLPDGSALNLLESLYSKQQVANCPVIVITGQEDTKNAVRLLKLGVQDYIVKDELTSNTLVRTLKTAIQNWKLTKQLEQMALYDSLTGLSNRGLFLEKLEQCFNESLRYDHHFALVLLDLDRFKSINDTYGHEAGDFVLEAIGSKLQKFSRKADVCGRLGGDEFAVILPETDDKSAHFVVQKLLKVLNFDLVWRNSVIPIASSIGASTFPSRANSYKELMREADIALYHAKNRGRSQFIFYNEEESELEDERGLLKEALPNAIKNGKLQVAFQSIVDRQQKVFAVEALLRWHHLGKWINPIETVNMVIELGYDFEFHEWLFDQTFSKLKSFQTAHPTLKLCLNLPANMCHNPKFSKLITRLNAKHNLAPSDVILEVTETHLMVYPDKAKACLEDLVNVGFNVAIDDFGTGYSSMEYIADLPCSILKIDKKFFLEMNNNKRYFKIIEAICTLAHGLDMKVIAEGIETLAHSEAAHKLHCDYLQGFYIGFPTIAGEDWQAYLTQSKIAQGD